MGEGERIVSKPAQRIDLALVVMGLLVVMYIMANAIGGLRRRVEILERGAKSADGR